MEEDRRWEHRKKLITVPEVIDRSSGKSIGKIVQMSAGGFLLEGNTKIEKGSLFEIRIDLLEELSTQPFESEARCVWVKESESEPRYRSGFEFSVFDEATNLLVARMILHYGF
jgi:c-di-GMP-binding flagellar brake protein YcgR